MSLTPFCSKIITDTGISMGDEGKGRLIPELIQELEESTGTPDPVGIVMKVNGGANSGHTAGGLKLNLLPAGIIAKRVPYLTIGAGVVADPRKFLWEAVPLEANGYEIFSRLRIDERCMVSDLGHRLLDLAWEYYRSEVLCEEPRGSTGRGITPAYADEVGQWQIFYFDYLRDKDYFVKKMTQRLSRAVKVIENVCEVSDDAWNGFFETLTNAEQRANAGNVEAGHFDLHEFDFLRFKGEKPFTLNLDEVIEVYWQAGQRWKNNICDVRELTLGVLEQGKYVIGEFGQSFWLDKRHGTPPNVTASHTFTPEIFQSAGIPVQPVHNVGCGKAYDTKVGTHVFLTQMEDGSHPIVEKLKKIEFGTSTGRQRMVGWFDAVEKGCALRYGGYDDLVINKLDALSFDPEWEEQELLVCTAYRDQEGNIVTVVPRDEEVRRNLIPVYERVPAWTEDISSARSYHDLPQAAKNYVALMVKSIVAVAYPEGIEGKKLFNLRYVGVGPEPSQIIKDIPSVKELLAS